MVPTKKSRTPKTTEEKPAAGTAVPKKVVVKKTAPKKNRAAKSISQKTLIPKTKTPETDIPKTRTETIPTKKTGGVFARAVQGTFFAAGRMISKTKKLKHINEIVKWKNISANAKTVFDSTKRGVTEIGGSIKGAVPMEKISNGTKKVWSSAKEEAIKVAGAIKNSVPMEKISTETKKVWKSTRQGARKIGRGTADGLTQIGQSFKEGYQSIAKQETAGRAEAPRSPVSEKIPAPSPARRPTSVRKKSALTELKPEENEVSEGVVDAALEKEVDQIVSEIGEI